MKYRKVGKIAGTFGLKGEFKVISETSFPKERFAVNKKLFIQTDNDYKEVSVRSFRMHKNQILLAVEELTDVDMVKPYVLKDLYAENDDIKLPENAYYPDEILGFTVYQGDKDLGKIISFDWLNEQPLMRIEKDGKSFLMLFIPLFVYQVDIQNKKVLINEDIDLG